MDRLVIGLVSLYLSLSLCLASSAHLDVAIQKTEEILSYLAARWQIDEYPNFLLSPIISHTSWQALKLKFERKILSALLGSTNRSDISFVMSFTGSSVTAGHDSPSNLSFSIVTRALMLPAFDSMGLKLISRNAAIGNNPCIPYDLCTRTFAGSDADLVHWEKSYNCNPSEPRHRFIFEQFIRQTMVLPSNPIVVFSDSIVPNWDSKECISSSMMKQLKLSRIDNRLKQLLNMSLADLAQSLNRLNQSELWRGLHEIASAYKTMGVQFWTHSHYDAYKCRGPYIAAWGCCSAVWHPSILGHELVASHFAYFWLLIFKDALLTVREKVKSSARNHFELQRLRDLADKHIRSELKHLPTKPLYPSNFIDGMKCYTTFEPRASDEGSLLSLVVNNQLKADDQSMKFFGFTIYENLTRPDIIDSARRRGYRDFKYMLYGNNESLPLNLFVSIERSGYLFICQPPSNWDKHPSGFGNLWDLEPQLWLSDSFSSSLGEELVLNNSRMLRYSRANPMLENLERICVVTDDFIPLGNHVLTIKPLTISFVMISYLLIP